MAQARRTNGTAAKKLAAHAWILTKAGCLAGFLLLANIAAAQEASTPAPVATEAQTKPAETRPAAPPKITYVGGQLKIDAVGATLGDVLQKVAALAGVTIDIPAAARSERMPMVELGPGPPREILASLLNDSNFDYLIQASDLDPARIQSVLLMTREKPGSVNTNGTGGRPTHSPFVRAAASPAKSEETPVTDNNAATTQTEIAAADTSNSQPAAPQQDPSAQTGDQAAPSDLAQTNPTPRGTFTSPNSSLQIPLAQPGLSPGAMSPPTTLNSQTINQQLQQMFQQRMQMNQQGQNSQPQTVRQ